ncbi:hypothetical protein Bbelb_256870 [Branchiostoma belcheri]|nr:hypothetical protein Bbelb_256870 [Branchiostoma belcheri]
MEDTPEKSNVIPVIVRVMGNAGPGRDCAGRTSGLALSLGAVPSRSFPQMMTHETTVYPEEQESFLGPPSTTPVGTYSTTDLGEGGECGVELSGTLWDPFLQFGMER